MTAPSARVTAGWLAARTPADQSARDATGVALADALGGWLREHCGRRRPARLVDVGAGAGAGAQWLHARLGMPQQWLLVDHDATLLASAAHGCAGWARTVVGDLGTLPSILDRDSAGWTTPVDAVTCQALLDLLYPADVRGLIGVAAGAGAAVLAALTVTGVVRLTPADPLDTVVAGAFNAHQRRGGRLGPGAGRFCAAALRDAGHTVTVVHTPWTLGPGHRGLLVEWLRGRAAAATQQEPERSAPIARWLNDRIAAARSGGLAAWVDHIDVLGLPPTGASAAR